MNLVRPLKLSLGLCSLLWISLVHAGTPVWSFTPDSNYPPKVTVSIFETATVKYIITNNSAKSHNLVLKPQTGISQNSACALGPKGSSSATCTLILTLTGGSLPAKGFSGGPVLCQANQDNTPNPNQCYQPAKKDLLMVTVVHGAPILKASIADLALSITGLTLNGQASGQSRVITISNIGDAPATGLSVNYPTFPSGTSIDSTSLTACVNGGTLAIGDSCTITVAPDANATSGTGGAACTTGIAPTPGVISVTANNANQTATNVVVLGYGCQYQGGFIYAMTETSDDSKSIGGNVSSLVDQAAPYLSAPQSTSVVWSSNGNVNAASFDLIPFIAASSANDSYANAQTAFDSTYNNTATFPFPLPGAFSTCNALSDGQCNSTNILAFYNSYNTGYGIGSSPYTLSAGPTNLNYYSAGLCTAIINGYTDWYLPSICELDPSTSIQFTCPIGTQSIVNSLSFLLGDPSLPQPNLSCSPPAGTDCLAGFYSSSTEDAVFPIQTIWGESFEAGNSFQSRFPKDTPLGVRCSRAF